MRAKRWIYETEIDRKGKKQRGRDREKRGASKQRLKWRQIESARFSKMFHISVYTL